MKGAGLFSGVCLILLGMFAFFTGSLFSRPVPPETGYFFAIIGALFVFWNWPSDKIEEIKEKIKKIFRYR